MNSKVKKTLVLLGLSLAVAIGFCGCGNEKSEETGIEIKKISEEEVYELLARVEEKAKKIEDARLSMDQGFQEKWDLLKRKQAAADRAFSKNDYNATSKFLQEAESAADWIMNRGPLRYEADEKKSVMKEAKEQAEKNLIAVGVYNEAVTLEKRGMAAYENTEFEKATGLFVQAKARFERTSELNSQMAIALNSAGRIRKTASDVRAIRHANSEFMKGIEYGKELVAVSKGNLNEENCLKYIHLANLAEEAFSRAVEESKKAQKNAKNAVVSIGNCKMDFVLVYSGVFKRGEQEVSLTKDFYIGKYEVTQAQWKAVMGNDPAHFKGADRPVEKVSWNDAMAFCEKLNESGKAPKGWKFTLPTEAQWEYAARGGNLSKRYEYSGSNDINEVAWYDDNSGDKTHDVGTKKPNELGLYDMSGNVWEWCLDWYDGYGDEKEVTDPQGPQSGSYRVVRGGGWYYRADFCLVAGRFSFSPDNRYFSIGFRLALVPVQ